MHPDNSTGAGAEEVTEAGEVRYPVGDLRMLGYYRTQTDPTPINKTQELQIR